MTFQQTEWKGNTKWLVDSTALERFTLLQLLSFPQRWKLNLLWGGGPAEAQMQLLGWEPQRITPGLWNLITHTSKLRGGKTCFGIHSTSECVLCASKFEKVLLTGVANSKTSANSKQTINPWTLCEITYCRIWICVYAVQAFQALFTTDTLIRATAGDQRWAEDKSPSS